MSDDECIVDSFPALQDQFDTLDFSDNELRKLEGFPLLKRLTTILLNNNRIWWARVYTTILTRHPESLKPQFLETEQLADIKSSISPQATKHLPIHDIILKYLIWNYAKLQLRKRKNNIAIFYDRPTLLTLAFNSNVGSYLLSQLHIW